jgi:hypothetical protein
MTFLWAVRAIDISCCVVTGSDFPALHAYLYIAIPEPTLPSVGEAGNDQLAAARQMVNQFLACPARCSFRVVNLRV